MKKIISLYQRNYDGDRLVRDEVVPGAEWVLAGEGKATRKFDGTCCMVRDGKLYKRYELRPGKSAPEGFEPAQDEDTTTGKRPGWLPVGDGPEDQYHREAWNNSPSGEPKDGTYELLGPKVQGGIEGFERHILFAHSAMPEFREDPRDFESIRAFLEKNAEIEGIVWHHPDGRMVKIKGKDFGIKRRSVVSA